jgi:hypothetical protein
VQTHRQPSYLTTSGRRAIVAEMVRSAAVTTDDPVLIVDVLDYVSAAVLRLAGVDPEAGLEILATLWRTP